MTEPRLEEKTNIQSNIGSALRKRREELGWNEQNIADHLRIRVELLHALEQGKYEALPGQAYAIGFLKNYAALLGLDAEKIVSIFKHELSASSHESEAVPQLDFPQATSERSLPKWLLITIGLAVVLAAYAGWYHFSSHDEDIAQKNNASLLVDNAEQDGSPDTEETETGAASEENNGQLADSETLSLNDNQSVSQQFVEGSTIGPAEKIPDNVSQNGRPQDERTNTAQNTIVQDHNSLDKSGLNNNNQVNNSLKHDGTPQNLAYPPVLKDASQKKSPFEAQEAPAASQAGQQNPGVASSILPPHVVEIHFTQDSWTKISDHSGKVIEARTFKAGETWKGDGNAAPYIVTAGNAAGVVVKAGSVTSAPLGKAGEVKRNLSVSAEDVVAGRFGHDDSSVNTPVSPVKTDNVLPSEPKNLEQIEQTH